MEERSIMKFNKSSVYENLITDLAKGQILNSHNYYHHVLITTQSYDEFRTISNNYQTK